MIELAEGEFAFKGHCKQVDEELALVVMEYVPGPQSLHDALPVIALYLPGSHAEQAPPSGPVVPGAHTVT
jgi:hypothetical protein